MLDYIVKFNKLPQELKDEISSPAVMAAIDDLESRYSVDLASLIMRVMVKEILFGSLADYFVEEYKFDRLSAEQLQMELAAKVFLKAADYLGIDLEQVLAKAQSMPEAAEDTMTVRPEVALPAASAGPQAGIKGAQFFFSPDDEEEIRKLSTNLGRPPEINKQLVEDRLNLALARANINFGSEAVAERFKQIIRTYLKGIRSSLDTKLTLTKAFDLGGLNFDEGTAEKMMALAEQSESEIKEEAAAAPTKAPVRLAVPEDKLAALKAVGAKDLEYDLAKEMAKRQQVRAQGAPPAAPASAAASQVKPLEPLAKPLERKTAVITPGEKSSLYRPADGIGKKKVEDVKHVPRTTGPVAELGNLDLVAFRRIDKDPTVIAAKIKEKIKSLEEERYSLRSEAIKAWRSSPINRLYLAIGEKAMIENKPIDIVIEEGGRSAQPALTQQEFEAIMRLNKELRF